MKWRSPRASALFMQIADRIKVEIAAGIYSPGDPMPTVRCYAKETGINPNTVQRAFAQLTEEGVLYTRSTTGRYVTEDVAFIETLRNKMRIDILSRMCNTARRLGFTKEEVLNFVSEHFDVK